ncbi:MAG: glycosyltransferase family 2 protein [Chromatiaceae bacterium]|nr:glycosyltransferase family 2 protein [Chromatiaceae bacterium]MCF7993338.1 glycosyltransferase family 2 protein [Chromatiaceae bacterium]MCF8014852.1 glycosyltransferase family 2 protein [Chromatiaceae bacterium]
MNAVVVVNYLQTSLTLDCLAALRARSQTPFVTILVDNASTTESRRAFFQLQLSYPRLQLICNHDNIGFAAACNQAFLEIFRDGRIRRVALLNNDAIVEHNWLNALTRQIDDGCSVGMVASRMMRMGGRDEVDSLGIAFYRSGIASNRTSIASPLLGPCGGAALYSTTLLHALTRADGTVFDEDYFCYAEDTELALRARGIGASCAFANDAVVQHWGTMSSGGPKNAFVAYHGIRNSLYNLIKHLPGDFLLRNAFAILAVQVAIVLQYLVKGQISIIYRVYRDTLRHAPSLLRARRIESQTSRVPWKQFLSREIYDPDYIRASLRDLFKRDVGRR